MSLYRTTDRQVREAIAESFREAPSRSWRLPVVMSYVQSDIPAGVTAADWRRR